MPDIPIFTTFQIVPLLRGGSILSWAIDQRYEAALPVTWTVQYSRSGVRSDSNNWITLTSFTSDTIAGTFTATDTNQRFWSTVERLFYRVQLTDANSVTVYSLPEPIFANLTRQQYLLAKQILRQEKVRMGPGQLGSCGLLFKRKTWGTICTEPYCIDTDTGETTNPNCPVCFGCGIVGGYYTGLEYPLTIEPTGNIAPKVNEGQALATDFRTAARAIAVPAPEVNDFYAAASDDRRWYIRRVDNIASIGGYPLICRLELALANPEDAVYSLPLNHTG